MKLHIAQVNTYDIWGGAEKIALTLNDIYNAKGHSSWLFVKKKIGNNSFVIEIDENKYSGPYFKFWNSLSKPFESCSGKIKGFSKINYWLKNFGRKGYISSYNNGLEYFNYPASRKLFEHLNKKIDIIHFHNLHGNYFDLSSLIDYSKQIPLFITLHDEWTFTGHCGYTLDCERWKIGCGNCPDLTLSPPVKKDSTDKNYIVKKNIYENSKLYVSAPSKWLLDKASESILKPAIIESKVIHNGVDLAIFHPSNKNESRIKIGLPNDALVLMFAAAGIKQSKFKDYKTMQEAVKIVAGCIKNQKIVFMAVGESTDDIIISENCIIKFFPFEKEPNKMANYYQSADIFLHAAKSDNFPTTILESLACGVPVVATAVGGIPEQIIHNETGLLVEKENPTYMANSIINLIEDKQKLTSMSNSAYIDASKRFDQNIMADEYLKWYLDVLSY
ncbi:MAG: glycosyltransferase [Armatimonadota bacterium]